MGALPLTPTSIKARTVSSCRQAGCTAAVTNRIEAPEKRVKKRKEQKKEDCSFGLEVAGEPVAIGGRCLQSIWNKPA